MTITVELRRSTQVAQRTLPGGRDGRIEIGFVGLYREGQDHLLVPDPAVDRPHGRASLARPQLQQSCLALQQFHVRRREVWAEHPKLVDDGVDRVALLPSLEGVEIAHGIRVEQDDEAGIHWLMEAVARTGSCVISETCV